MLPGRYSCPDPARTRRRRDVAAASLAAGPNFGDRGQMNRPGIRPQVRGARFSMGEKTWIHSLSVQPEGRATIAPPSPKRDDQGSQETTRWGKRPSTPESPRSNPCTSTQVEIQRSPGSPGSPPTPPRDAFGRNQAATGPRRSTPDRDRARRTRETGATQGGSPFRTLVGSADRTAGARSPRSRRRFQLRHRRGRAWFAMSTGS
jgi:hypothetical protein